MLAVGTCLASRGTIVKPSKDPIIVVAGETHASPWWVYNTTASAVAWVCRVMEYFPSAEGFRYGP